MKIIYNMNNITNKAFCQIYIKYSSVIFFLKSCNRKREECILYYFRKKSISCFNHD